MPMACVVATTPPPPPGARPPHPVPAPVTTNSLWAQLCITTITEIPPENLRLGKLNACQRRACNGARPDAGSIRALPRTKPPTDPLTNSRIKPNEYRPVVHIYSRPANQPILRHNRPTEQPTNHPQEHSQITPPEQTPPGRGREKTPTVDPSKIVTAR